MNPKKLFHLLSISSLVILVALTGCDSMQRKGFSGKNKDFTQDSIIEQVMGKDLDSALKVIDDLENKKKISEGKANYYRGQIHYKLGQELSAELYFKRSLVNDDLLQERPSMYYYVSDQLSTILTVKGDQEGAIDIATEAYSVIQKDTTQIGHYWSAILLHDIGYSQMQYF